MSVWLLLAAPLLIFLQFWYSCLRAAKKPQVYGRHGSDLTSLVSDLPCLQTVFSPTWWCPFGFPQTFVRAMLRSCPSLPWKREVVEFPDGGCCALDWLEPENSDENTPIVFLLPGIAGSTHECSYIIHAALEVQRQGWRSVVVNPRGLGGVPLKTSRTYNGANCDDFMHVVEMITQRHPVAKKMACGFSMGGMLLWHYVARSTKDTVGLQAALIVSSPFDSFKSAESLEAFWPSLFFNSHINECLKKIVRPHKHLFEDKVDWDALMKTKTMRAFDMHFVVPMFGYDDWEQYYRDSTLKTKVHDICIPTLALNSWDDCFAPIDSMPLDEITQSENVVAVITRHGGHTSFMSHQNPEENGLVEPLLAQLGGAVFAE